MAYIVYKNKRILIREARKNVDMFSIWRMARYYSDRKHDSILKRCGIDMASSKEEFVKKYGMPLGECNLTDGYNQMIDLVSEKDTVKLFRYDKAIWAVWNEEDEYEYANDNAKINFLLMSYVMSQHCDGYDDVELLGFWDMVSGNIMTFDPRTLKTITLETVSYNYIGYLKKSDEWRDAGDTNMSVFYEMVSLMKRHPWYAKQLRNFKYEIQEPKLITKIVDKANSNYLASRDFHFLSEPLAYGGGIRSFNINYISDIHLEHHLDYSIDMMSQIRKIVRQLCSSMQDGYVFFAGDTGDKKEDVSFFYKEFITRVKLKDYKRWKKMNHYIPPMGHSDAIGKYEKRVTHLKDMIKNEIDYIKPWVSYNKKFRDRTYSDLERYLESGYYKRNHYPEFIAIRIKKIHRLETEFKYFTENKEKYVEDYESGSGEQYYSVETPEEIFAVIGNHELSDFRVLSDGKDYYRALFEELGIRYLDNTLLSNGSVVIYGGIGFAKYNAKYNASTLICSEDFTREKEQKETDAFEKGYNNALRKAIDERKPLLVISHYPVEDCLGGGRCDSHAVYFNGHNHRNRYEGTEQRNIYADNQIGYKNKNILFKCAKVGRVYNPFNGYEDGCYEITTDQYSDFYTYCGDRIMGTSKINNVIRDGGCLLMIKNNGFYGFFLRDKFDTIAICEGGNIKYISGVKNLEFLIANFSRMIEAYLTVMLPFRNYQEKVSQQIQAIGLDGRIHGTIIDVDTFHHIMINLYDGKITYYYSPIFGMAQEFTSFEDLLKHVDKEYISSTSYEKRYIENRARGQGVILPKTSNSSSAIGKMTLISIKDSPYVVSRKINQLQRLFTARVLRDWDTDLLQYGKGIEEGIIVDEPNIDDTIDM